MTSIKLRREELEGFCGHIFETYGVRSERASCQAKVLVAADARGIPSHGVARLPRYIAGLETRQMLPDAEPLTLRESPTSLLVDARGGLGGPVSAMAMRTVIEKAEKSGMAFASVGNSNHFGIAGYYAMMALDHDMIGLAMTNTAALGVPTNAKQVMFGTNPIAFAAPASREKAFVLDMSTTVVTRGKIEVYERAGEELPPGWAVDKNGLPAKDPKSLLLDMFYRRGGGIVPLGGDSEKSGGHKGYGLAIMVDVLTGMLAGAGVGPSIMDTEVSSARVSHCFAAMRIDLFQDPRVFKNSMDEMLSALRSCEPADEETRVYYAGLKEAESEDITSLEGVVLESSVYERLRSIGIQRHVEMPAPLLQAGSK
jgi:L-2-hydroxycarboxylate dehydrogenase (NAD+)